MVFSNLNHQDKEAFFSLLDEYFASRPHLVGGSSNSSGPSIPISAITSRLLPPSRSSSGPPTPPASSSPVSPVYSNGNNSNEPQQDMAQRFISSSIRLGTAGTKAGVGAIAKNKDAMDLLGKAGMGGMVRHTNNRINSQDKQETHGQGQIVEIESTTVTTKAPAPAPPKKKGGVSGLVSGRSFGHVDTSSKMSAFTSMWKDPQKVQSPTVEHNLAPALSTQQTSLPPPVKRSTSGSHSSPAPALVIQAQALYDYEGSDSNDLSVQSGQIVNILEKTSADWWTCEDGNGQRGLVPANYLQES